MDMLDFYIRVVKALDEIGAPYMIVGAFIYAILFFCLRGFSNYQVDIEEVAEQAARIGPETLDMWLKTLARAREEIEKEDTPRKW